MQVVDHSHHGGVRRHNPWNGQRVHLHVCLNGGRWVLLWLHRGIAGDHPFVNGCQRQGEERGLGVWASGRFGGGTGRGSCVLWHRAYHFAVGLQSSRTHAAVGPEPREHARSASMGNSARHHSIIDAGRDHLTTLSVTKCRRWMQWWGIASSASSPGRCSRRSVERSRVSQR